MPQPSEKDMARRAAQAEQEEIAAFIEKWSQAEYEGGIQRATLKVVAKAVRDGAHHEES